MLPRPNRLQKERDFRRVYSLGHPFYSNELRLKFITNMQENTRFGFVVNNKISNKSVERNRIKRQLREITRKNIDKVINGFDVVIIAKKTIIDKTYREKEKAVINLLKRVKLIKNE